MFKPVRYRGNLCLVSSICTQEKTFLATEGNRREQLSAPIMKSNWMLKYSLLSSLVFDNVDEEILSFNNTNKFQNKRRRFKFNFLRENIFDGVKSIATYIHVCRPL